MWSGRDDMMVFDLDPGAPADILSCAQVGLWLRGSLDDLKLKSFPEEFRLERFADLRLQSR